MRICFMGDSFVDGFGDPAYQGWVGRLCELARADGHELTAYNLGVRGDTSASILARWRAEAFRRLPESEPRGLVFSFGTNDVVGGEDGQWRVPLDESVENAIDMLAYAKRSMPVLFVGPPPTAIDEENGRIAALSYAYHRACEQLAVSYFDSYAALADSDVWMHEVAAGDGAHPGAAGYQVWAELIHTSAAWRSFMFQPGHPDV